MVEKPAFKENMKNLLTEKNIVRGVIALLVLSSVCLHLEGRETKRSQRGMIERMRGGRAPQRTMPEMREGLKNLEKGVKERGRRSLKEGFDKLEKEVIK